MGTQVRKEVREGYPRLGCFMGRYPSMAIFRRFAALKTENLLYLQAELKVLEIDLRRYQLADRDSKHEDREIYSQDWETLKDSCNASASTGNDRKQWNTLLKIREKLKEYNTALLQERQIMEIEQPVKKDLKLLRDWMGSVRMGNVFLLGPDRHLWKEDEDDFIALKQRKAEDPLFIWISENLIQRFHQSFGRYFKRPSGEGDDAPYMSNLVSYSDNSILRIVRLVIIVLACLLPVVAIVILSLADTTSKRLGVIGGLTVLFSICLGCLTSAKISEIFATTAAFVAVLVVFVGNPTT